MKVLGYWGVIYFVFTFEWVVECKQGENLVFDICPMERNKAHIAKAYFNLQTKKMKNKV